MGTNDITNNLLYIRKGKKDFTTKLDEINFVDDNNITEDQLRSKKSERQHLNQRGNSLSVENILKYLRDPFETVVFLSCAVDSCECKF